jgi:hypothetical protein
MFSIYNKNTIIFRDPSEEIEFPFGEEITDYEDTFVIETRIAIDDIRRGWIGDVEILLSGQSIDATCNWNDKVNDAVIHRDVLCYRRIMEFDSEHVAVWKYMFMKY